MEIVRVESIDLEKVADLLSVATGDRNLKPRDHTRWHVTNLLESANQIARGNHVYHEYQGAPLGIMSMGRIWETAADSYMAWYADLRSGFYTANVEIQLDDVVASLDGLVGMKVDGESQTAIVESKLRFSPGPDSGIQPGIPPRHLQQIQAYCHMAKVWAVVMPVLYLTSGPPRAEAQLKFIVTDPARCAETWAGMMSTKQFLESKGLSPTTKKES